MIKIRLSWSEHGQIMLRSWSDHDRIMIRPWSFWDGLVKTCFCIVSLWTKHCEHLFEILALINRNVVGLRSARRSVQGFTRGLSKTQENPQWVQLKTDLQQFTQQVFRWEVVKYYWTNLFVALSSDPKLNQDESVAQSQHWYKLF